MDKTKETMAGLTALVVEDEMLIAEEINQRLRELGMGLVEIVDSGEGALALAGHLEPDLVLMDIRLRGDLDGVETAERLRKLVKVPVVFLTAHSDVETLRRAKETDPFGYLLKPFNGRELEVAIEMSLHRHQLEKALRESKSRYAATLASIGDGVIATDARGRVNFLNPVAEALTGWNLAEAEGRSIARVLPLLTEEDRVVDPHPMLELVAEGAVDFRCQPCLLATRDHARIPIDDSLTTIRDEEGEVVGAVIAFRDIRQRKLAEDALRNAQDQLRQAQKMEAVGRLAGGVAHDFNNLLMVIMGSAEMILEEADLPPGARGLAEDIHRTGQRARRLTRQLLSFSRQEITRPQALRVDELLAEIEALLVRLLTGQVDLTTSYEEGLWSIKIDHGQMEQVLLNLAVNSRDAMPGGGSMSIRARNVLLSEEEALALPASGPGPYVRITVQDTGEGMDEEAREKAFEPFFTTKQKGQGTGLGLATVYSVVQQAGGFVTLKSQVGQGTTFYLYFPALTVKGEPLEEDEEAESRPELEGTETVLLVDDDSSVRGVIARALHIRGYTVHEAGNGAAALQLLAEIDEPIQLMISDVVMQGMGGRELARKVQRDFPDLKTILISGWTEDPELRAEVERGEYNFLKKPFEMTELLEKTRRLLDG